MAVSIISPLNSQLKQNYKKKEAGSEIPRWLRREIDRCLPHVSKMSVEKKKKTHVLHAMGNIAVHETIFISARGKNLRCFFGHRGEERRLRHGDVKLHPRDFLAETGRARVHGRGEDGTELHEIME